MLYINPSNNEVKVALNKHYKYFKTNIDDKLNKYKKFSTFWSVKHKVKGYEKEDLKYFSKNFYIINQYLNRKEKLKVLLKGLPEELEEINNDLLFLLKKKNAYIDGSTKRYITYLLDYKAFSSLEPSDSYSIYHLTKDLKRRTCTYCNRSYINTMTTKHNNKLMRPQLDHWFPQESYPLLGLSFFNLIPSCSICNSSIKSNKIMNLKYLNHPYKDTTQSDDFRFTYYLNGPNDYTIDIKKTNGTKAFNTAKFLSLDNVYNAHTDELEDLLELRKIYNSTYTTQIKSILESSISSSEIYRIVFGTEMIGSNYHKRPLSKFKSDILKELGIIKK